MIVQQVQKAIFFFQDADRIRRDSVICEEVPKTEPKLTVTKEEPTEETKIEVTKLWVASEVSDNENKQTNIEDEFGIKAEALYDYQAGS